MGIALVVATLIATAPLLDVQWAPDSARTGKMLDLMVTVSPTAAAIQQLEIVLDGKRGIAMPASKDRHTWRALAPIEIEAKIEPIELRVDARLSDGEQVHWQKPVAIREGDYDQRNITVGRKFTSPSKQQQKRAARESKELAAVLETMSPERLWRGSWAKPVKGEETSPFGTLRTYNKKRRSRHMGLDLDGEIGDPIVAGNRARVLMATDRFYSGGTVVLDHGQGFITMAFHMSRIDVKVGQLVEKGELLGAVGKSGQVTGPHLHFTAKLDNVSVDPAQLLKLDLSADDDDVLPTSAVQRSPALPSSKSPPAKLSTSPK